MESRISRSRSVIGHRWLGSGRINLENLWVADGFCFWESAKRAEWRHWRRRRGSHRRRRQAEPLRSRMAVPDRRPRSDFGSGRGGSAWRLTSASRETRSAGAGKSITSSPPRMHTWGGSALRICVIFMVDSHLCITRLEHAPSET